MTNKQAKKTKEKRGNFVCNQHTRVVNKIDKKTLPLSSGTFKFKKISVVFFGSKLQFITFLQGKSRKSLILM